MKPSLLITLLFVSLTCYTQTTNIGSLIFTPVDAENKPRTTLYSTHTVYEDNFSQSGKTISLYLEVIPARDSSSKKDPMFILMGGPGQAATDLVPFFYKIFHELNQQSDLVFVDQRGTGKSNPLKLKIDYRELQSYFTDHWNYPELIRANFEWLSLDNDLSKYGTANAVLDLESVREAMSYEKINLYGTSYGTRVALRYMNQYPGKVRTATLKGLVPQRTIIGYHFAEDAQRSLEMLIRNCNEDPACSQAYPNFEEEVETLLSTTSTMEAELPNPNTGEVETVELSPELIALTLRGLLSSPTITQTIPFMLHEAVNGNYGPLAHIILRLKYTYAQGLYSGLMLSVVCYDDYPKLQEAPAQDLQRYFLGSYWVDRIENACSIWNPNRDLGDQLPVKQANVNIPVLLISGNRDSATPPRYGEMVKKVYPYSTHLVIEEGGHSFDGLLGCVDTIINEFVISGSLENLDTSCVQEITFPEFKLE